MVNSWQVECLVKARELLIIIYSFPPDGYILDQISAHSSFQADILLKIFIQNLTVAFIFVLVKYNLQKSGLFTTFLVNFPVQVDQKSQFRVKCSRFGIVFFLLSYSFFGQLREIEGTKETKNDLFSRFR